VTTLADLNLNGQKAAANHVRLAINGLHTDVLIWLLATDRRAGTAYRLGRSLFMTTGNREAHLDQLQNMFKDRTIEIYKWLNELAPALPPYSAKVVQHSLRLWTDEVSNAAQVPDSESRLRRMARVLPQQGEVWRSLLTGDLDGRVVLSSDDYADIAEHLVLDERRLLGVLSRRILFTRPIRHGYGPPRTASQGSRRHGLPLAVYFTLAICVILIVGVFAGSCSPTVRTAAAPADRQPCVTCVPPVAVGVRHF